MIGFAPLHLNEFHVTRGAFQIRLSHEAALVDNVYYESQNCCERQPKDR